MSKETLTVSGLRERLFRQLDKLDKTEPFEPHHASIAASLAAAINKSWEMQVAMERLKREVQEQSHKRAKTDLSNAVYRAELRGESP